MASTSLRSGSRSPAKLVVAGPFVDDINYDVVYGTGLSAGSIEIGRKYTNQDRGRQRVTGKTATFECVQLLEERFDATVYMKQGFGTFIVTKQAEGSGAAALPANPRRRR